MTKNNKNISSNQSDSEAEKETEASRKQGGAESTLQQNQSTVAIIGGHPHQRELRQIITNFLIQFITRVLTFIISLIPGTFLMDQLTAQQHASQPRLRLTDILMQRMKSCTHPAHKNLEKTALIREVPTAYFELMVQDSIKDKQLSQNEVAIASNSLNAKLVERLLEVDAKSPNNTELKLLNYQEWVDMLLKINKVLLKNMCDLEDEFLHIFRICTAKNVEYAKLLKSYKADIKRLTDLVRQAQIEGNWNFKDFLFETFDGTEILDVKNVQAKFSNITI